ncbi:MAG: insulinase family protein [Candidatus Fournierella pullistercoris]|uniref:Insulinase family protein n=1 Tax=Candidatus Allofournierella pullistercoris TaxID=2838597 RepID=A0A948T2Y6_9FIRM|nr:insulinase family protein [Candidatus Fournierella pullistercoris]
MQDMIQEIAGFRLIKKRPIQELEGTLWEMEHIRSGAQLVWLERNEENKTFGIAFRTPPWDDTGLFHILEHSVLCGSRRYPVKEPFVQLLKSSLNTFLNAMTFPDKTFYPVSSRNEQDFFNLMRVYMDAVLHPLIGEKPEIFSQEGWHYELDENNQLSYKGVVFNEMKGAFASPDRLMYNAVQKGLFPDNCYGFVSGGDPKSIVDLTYEQFMDAHQRLYHPSNGYVFLDGQIPLEKVLRVLDEEFFAEYERIQIDSSIPMQAPVCAPVATLSYALSPQQPLEGRSRIGLGYVTGTFADKQEIVALNVLADVLCGDNQAPLSRCLLNQGLAQDVSLSLTDSVQQPWMFLTAQDVKAEDCETVKTALEQELSRLATEGLDKERILSSLDYLEFQMRQKDYGSYPQGLIFGMSVLDTWLYGGDPAQNLWIGDLFDTLRAECEKGYFEQLIRRVFLENPHRAFVMLHPSHTLSTEQQQQEQQRLRETLESFTSEQLEEVRQWQKHLDAWQNTPDTPEDLATIPLLKLEEISAKPAELPLEEITLAGIPVLFHRQPTQGLVYAQLYFVADDLTEEQLSQLSFLTDVLGDLDTQQFTADSLQKKLRSTFGSFHCTISSYPMAGQPEQCRVFFVVGFRILEEKLPQGLALMQEIVAHSKLDNPERMQEILRQNRTGLFQQLVMSGHQAAIGRAQASFSADAVVGEVTGGVRYFQWLKALEDDFDSQFPALVQQMDALLDKLFVRERLTVSVTCGGHEPAEQVANHLAAHLQQGTAVPTGCQTIQPWGIRREGILIPADVSFAALSAPFSPSNAGAAQVMGRGVSLDYLWNNVRVQGGAYGTGMAVSDSHLVSFYSYRDPNAKRTLQCYAQTPEALNKLACEDLTGFILGAIAQADPLLTPRQRGITADSLYWRGISNEARAKRLEQVLHCQSDDLLAMSQPLADSLAQAAVCVLGSQSQLDACGEMLDSQLVL